MRYSIVAGLIALLAGLPESAAAQKYPARPVTMVVPFPAGGLSDVAARALAIEWQRRMNASFVVENRVGGSGTIGAGYVARAVPDGYTLLVNSIADVMNLHYVSPPYDILKDFAAIGMIVQGPPMVLLVNPNTPFRSVAELVAYGKANPGKLNFASAGPGTPASVATSQLNHDAGLNIVDVPYRGSVATALAVVSGEVQASFVFYGTARELANEGKVRPLVSTARVRDPSWPEIPTMIESGFPDFVYEAFSGLAAPAKTPPDIIALLNSQLNAVIHEPAYSSRFKANGMYPPAPNSPEAFATYMTKEVERNGELAKLTQKSK